MMSACDSSWLNSFPPAGTTSDIMRLSIGQFIAQQSEALGSLDGNDMFPPVSKDSNIFNIGITHEPLQTLSINRCF